MPKATWLVTGPRAEGMLLRQQWEGIEMDEWSEISSWFWIAWFGFLGPPLHLHLCKTLSGRDHGAEIAAAGRMGGAYAWLSWLPELSLVKPHNHRSRRRWMSSSQMSGFCTGEKGQLWRCGKLLSTFVKCVMLHIFMCHHGCSCYGSLDAQPDEVFWHRCCSDAIIVDAEGCCFTGAEDDSLSMKAAIPNSIL